MVSGTSGYDGGIVADAATPTQEPTVTYEPTTEPFAVLPRAAQAPWPA